MSNILPKDSSKVSYIQKLTVSKHFDHFAKRTLRVTKTALEVIKLEFILRLKIKHNDWLLEQEEHRLEVYVPLWALFLVILYC